MTPSLEIKQSRDPVLCMDAQAWMKDRVFAIYNKTAPECLWFLEHAPFYARGRGAHDDEYNEHNAPHIPVYDVQRGGKYTYHGPGQRVVYVMIDLSVRARDLKKYIYNLESWIIDALRRLGVAGFRAPMGIGVWVTHRGKPHKIAAMGVHVSKWVTSHGIALNISTDLNAYRGITPCGIHDFSVTSLREIGVDHTTQAVDDALMHCFHENEFLVGDFHNH